MQVGPLGQSPSFLTVYSSSQRRSKTWFVADVQIFVFGSSWIIASRAGGFSGTWDHHRIIDSVVIHLIFQTYTLVTWDNHPICKITKTLSAHLWTLPGAQENAGQEIMEMIIPNNENQSGNPLTSDYVPYLFHCHSGWSHMKSSFHHFIAMTVGEMSVVLSMLISHWSLVFVYVRIYQLEENAAIGSNTWYTLRIPLQRLVIGCLKKVP
jgi:hypothetical protein